MNRRYIGYNFNKYSGGYEWMQQERRELYEWVKETAGDHWKLEAELDVEFHDITLGGECWNIFIIYEDDSNAVHHKLRWE